MSKRPTFDLASLTAEAAEPMQEAAQRAAKPLPIPSTLAASEGKEVDPAAVEHLKPADLEPLAFKVSRQFSKRFRKRAFDADLKLNKLLFEALDAWEEKNDIK